MADFIEVANWTNFRRGRAPALSVVGKEVALFNVEGTICVMADACLHQGVSLGASKLEGDVVTCRGHGWRYDVCTGKTLHVPDYGVATYSAEQWWTEKSWWQSHELHAALQQWSRIEGFDLQKVHDE
jgi:nitrite reductase/ring-hydroxylating ferredoxin subunit